MSNVYPVSHTTLMCAQASISGSVTLESLVPEIAEHRKVTHANQRLTLEVQVKTGSLEVFPMEDTTPGLSYTVEEGYILSLPDIEKVSFDGAATIFIVIRG